MSKTMSNSAIIVFSCTRNNLSDFISKLKGEALQTAPKAGVRLMGTAAFAINEPPAAIMAFCEKKQRGEKTTFHLCFMGCKNYENSEWEDLLKTTFEKSTFISHRVEKNNSPKEIAATIFGNNIKQLRRNNAEKIAMAS